MQKGAACPCEWSPSCDLSQYIATCYLDIYRWPTYFMNAGVAVVEMQAVIDVIKYPSELI